MSATLFGGRRLLLYVKVVALPVELSPRQEIPVSELPGDDCQDVFRSKPGAGSNQSQRRAPRRFFTCFSEP